MKRNILFLGAPGSGKGTQSAYIIRDCGVVQISTGDILREAVKNDSDLGKLVKKYLDEGQLVPDDVIINIMKERLKQPDCANGVIFDGFPRTVAQAEALEVMLEGLGLTLTHVISLEVPDKAIYERITGRRSCSKCNKPYHIKFNPPKVADKCDDDGAKLLQRSDDTESTISKRLKVYHDSTATLISFYDKRTKMLLVDGTGDPDKIYSEKIRAFLE